MAKLSELEPSVADEDIEVILEGDDDDDYDTQMEEDLTEAKDLLETCHQVLRRIVARNRMLNTEYNRNLLVDIENFVLKMEEPVDKKDRGSNSGSDSN